MNQSPPAVFFCCCFFFFSFEVEISLHALITFSRPGSVHSGSYLEEEKPHEFAVSLFNRPLLSLALVDLDEGSTEKRNGYELEAYSLTSTCEELPGFSKRKLKSRLSKEAAEMIKDRRDLKRRL